MKSIKLLSLILLVALSLSYSVSAQTDAQQAQIRVHTVNASSALQSSNWDQALINVDKAQDLLGSSAAIFESIRVKAYYGKKDYQRAKEHLLIFFQLSPADNLIDEIAPISAEIEENINRQRNLQAEERKKKEMQKAFIAERDRELDNLRSRQGKFYDQTVKITYNTIKIGNQIWLSENLNSSKLNDGVVINQATSDKDFNEANLKKIPVWAYYNYETKNKRYGKLYNWYAVSSNKLCPSGWEVPSDEDWNELSNYLGGKNVAGQFLKSEYGWSENGDGNNKSGFSGIPSGYRDHSLIDGKYFQVIGKVSSWWSFNSQDFDDVWSWGLSFNNSRIFKFSGHKNQGIAVRCLQK